jgi:glycosyltransferase involved in cell wall biosynthesis
MPEISIIIPNFNQARYLCETIQSALNQSYSSFETIVVDDGSTDESREVVEKFGARVRYIWQGNQGLAGARNTGIRAAQGEFIGLLDADDQWLPSYLEVMHSLATRRPDGAIYYCSALSIDSEGHNLPQVFGGPARPPETIYWTLLRANFLIPSTILMRRSAVLEAGLFDQTLRSCEDWDLWLRMLPDKKFIGTSECLVRYRIHGTSLSANPAGMQHANRATIEKKFGEDDGDHKSWSKEKLRAYGGVYCYHALTSIQRQYDWHGAANYLKQALSVDPTLAKDLDLFYDLAFGAQPPGYRGSKYQLNLIKNASLIHSLLENVFCSPLPEELKSLKRQTFGTAYFAIGLVAYNTGYRSISRRFLITAIIYRNDLLRDNRVLGALMRSFIIPSVLIRSKKNGKKACN